MKRTEVFPFNGQFKRDSLQFVGPIVSMNNIGFVATIGTQILRPGENFVVSFDLPLTSKTVEVPVVVVKVADKIVSGVLENGKPKMERRAEFHFKNPTPEFKKALSAFFINFNSLD